MSKRRTRDELNADPYRLQRADERRRRRTRHATCGACGTEREVTDFMRKDFDSQFTPRPNETTDSFYCGCQNDDDIDCPPGLGFD